MQSAPMAARLVNLIRIDHEILAQHRQLARGAGLLQVIHFTLKKLHIGQHRQAGSTKFGITLGNVGRE